MNFFVIFFTYFFYEYIKCLKIHELDIIKKIKNDYEKVLVKEIKSFLKKAREKSDNMVADITKMYQKKKNKSLLSIEKNITE